MVRLLNEKSRFQKIACSILNFSQSQKQNIYFLGSHINKFIIYIGIYTIYIYNTCNIVYISYEVRILNDCYFLWVKEKREMGDIVFNAGYFQACSFLGDDEFVQDFIVLQISMLEPLMRMLS